MCDKTCIFCFFPVINKYLCMAKRSLLSRCPSYFIFCSSFRFTILVTVCGLIVSTPVVFILWQLRTFLFGREGEVWKPKLLTCSLDQHIFCYGFGDGFIVFSLVTSFTRTQAIKNIFNPRNTVGRNNNVI